jgi:hypothetical protein
MISRSAGAQLTQALLLGVAALLGVGALHHRVEAQEKRSVKIHLQYSTRVDRVRPWPIGGTVDNDVTVILSGKNSIQESFNMRAAIFGQSENQSTSLRGVGEGRWRVAGANKLIRINSWPQSQTFLTVNVTGRTCSLNVEYRLRPGFTEYKFWDFQLQTWAYYSQASFLGGTCSIESTSSG